MTRSCPTCGRPAPWDDNPDRPFCSERCRLIDLGHWASEDYAVPEDPHTAEIGEIEEEDHR